MLIEIQGFVNNEIFAKKSAFFSETGTIAASLSARLLSRLSVTVIAMVCPR